jgi:PAS domain S-box-containing protein
MTQIELYWALKLAVVLVLPFGLLLAALGLHRAAPTVREPAWHVAMAAGAFLLMTAPSEARIAGWRIPIAIPLTVPPLVALNLMCQRVDGTMASHRAALTLAIAGFGVVVLTGLLALVGLAPPLPIEELTVRLTALGAGILTARMTWFDVEETGGRPWEVLWGAGVVGLATFIASWSALMVGIGLGQRPSVVLLGIPPLIGAACGAVVGFYVNAHEVEHPRPIIKRPRSLLDAEKRYGRFFQDYPTGLLLVDLDTGAIVDANERAQELTGAGANELEGQALESLFLEQVPEESQKGRFTLRRRGAEPLPVGGRTSKLSVGDRQYQVVAFQDIRQELEDIDRQIRIERLEVVSRLAGGLSHDFSNVLQGILGFASHLKADSQPEALTKGLSAIHRYAKRGSEIAKRLRALSREPEFNRGNCNAGDVVFDARELIERGVALGMTLQIRVCRDPTPIGIPAGRLQDILLHLAIHARDNMPEGGILRIEVTIETVEPREEHQTVGPEQGIYVQVSVNDTGEGADPALGEEAFEPYRSLEGGTAGLGLAVVWSTVRSVGGWAEIEAVPGAGTTVRLLFPRVANPVERDLLESAADGDSPATSFLLLGEDSGPRPVIEEFSVHRASQGGPLEMEHVGEPGPDPEHVEADPMSEPSPEAQAEPKKATVRRVLVVDDEEDLRSMLEILLGARGIEVIEADGGRSALQLLEQDQDFDAIVLDMVMPGMDGGEVLKELSARGLDIPVVLATGFSPRELDPAARAMVAATLRKPFQTDALVAVLQACVDKSSESSKS